MEDFQENILKIRIFSNTVIFQVIVKFFSNVIYVKRTIILAIKLWWMKTPTSITSVFIKNSFFFVKIRSMQFGFQDCKQVGFFIKHSRSNVAMKFLRLLLLIVKENCHNSRTSNDIDVKLGSVTKLNKWSKTRSKKFDDDVMTANCDVSVIFLQFIANLGPFGSRIPDESSVKRTFSLKENFYLTKTEKSTLLLWVKVLFLQKNAHFLQKNADISKIRSALELKIIFSETKNVSVVTYQVSSF